MSSSKAIKTIYFSIAANLVLVAVKIGAGWLGNSFALIADGIESSADVMSSVLLLFGLMYASMPPDKNHPYGHGRAEPLFTFIVVAFLIASAVVIAYQSIINIQTPHSLPKPFTLIVLGVIILSKEIFYRIISRKAKEVNSTSIKGDAWHHRSDAITSLAAFIGISIALYFGEGYEAADDWAALLACVFILYNCYLIFRPALAEIMDEHIYDDVIEQVRAVSKTVTGIVDTEKCFVRKIGQMYHIDLHATVRAAISVREGHDIAHNLEAELVKQVPHVVKVLVHIEPDDL